MAAGTDGYFVLRDSILESELEPHLKLLALAILRHWPHCKPGVKRLAMMCSASPRSIKRYIQQLEAAGALVVERRNGSQEGSTYHLTGATTLAPVTGVSPVPNPAGTGANRDTPPVPNPAGTGATALSPKEIRKEIQKEIRKESISSSPPPAAVDPPEPAPTEGSSAQEPERPTGVERSGAAKATSADVQRVFECWQREHEHPAAKLDPKRRARIKARLREGYTAQQLEQAIRGATKDDWLMGRDPKSRGKFDGLETLLRDAAQVERLIELEQAPPGAIRYASGKEDAMSYLMRLARGEDVPNQPNAGVTGLEKAQIVRSSDGRNHGDVFAYATRRISQEEHLQRQADRIQMLREQEAEEERRAAAGGGS